MSKHILKTPEGKKVVVDLQTDIQLYESPVNPPNTGSDYTRGEDLFAHKTRSNNWYYYLHYWSMWQGEKPRIELITKDNAEKFLIHIASKIDHAALTESEIKLAEEHGFKLFDEDA